MSASASEEHLWSERHGGVTALAPAKINLTLDVLGRRADGYHELRSIMQTVAWYDTLDFGVATEITLQTNRRELDGPDNLVLRAAHLLRDYHHAVPQAVTAKQGARIVLHKELPVAGGIGGGSSNAATTLRTLNDLWGMTLSREALVPLAARVGSDVPFFLWGGTAIIAGRGEVVTPLPPLPALPLLVVTPPLSVSTAKIFGALSSEEWTDGRATDQLAAYLDAHATNPVVLSDVTRWPPLHNCLQQTTCRLYPQVDDVLKTIRSSGAAITLMSGSGPTCFGLYCTGAERDAAATMLYGRGWMVSGTTLLP